MSDIPRDTIQVVLKIRTKLGKHTLTEDHKKRTEKCRLWEKCSQCITIDPMEKVEPISLQKVHGSGSSSDLGAWIQVDGDLEFMCMIFNYPKNMSSDKENTPIFDTQPSLTLNNLNITNDTRHEGLPETQKFCWSLLP